YTANGQRANDEVDPGILLKGRDGSTWDRDQDRDHGGEQRNLERYRQPGEDFGRNGFARPHRDTEVELEETPDEFEELHDHRLVGADFGVADIDGVRIEAATTGAQANHADVTRNQPHQCKHEHGCPDQSGDNQKHTLDDVLIHGGWFLVDLAA